MMRSPIPADHRFKTLVCAGCLHTERILLNCGDRTCPYCRRKWFGYHYKNLVKIVSGWQNTISLTLTVKNIPDVEFCAQSVKQIRNQFTRLRAFFSPALKSGFYVVQATNRGKGWHLHIHALFDSVFVSQKELSEKWKSITGSYIVYVRRVPRSGIRKAVGYLLSDFQGAPRIRPFDNFAYNQAFKSSRLVQGFGAFLKQFREKFFRCPVCGGVKWYCLEAVYFGNEYREVLDEAFDSS